jgi:hypothetical protein
MRKGLFCSATDSGRMLSRICDKSRAKHVCQNSVLTELNLQRPRVKPFMVGQHRSVPLLGCRERSRAVKSGRPTTDLPRVIWIKWA